jgi:hypothetical protein
VKVRGYRPDLENGVLNHTANAEERRPRRSKAARGCGEHQKS